MKGGERLKYIYPKYYDAFSCIKGDCKHSCCKGWEIDIDKEHLEAFQNTDGSIGKKLRESISLEGNPHFILDEQERCPFLNTEGLCDLIIALGKECLCDICKEHPRFYNCFEDRTEVGLGLCCEAACRLILKQNPAEELYPSTTSSDDTAQNRDALLRLVQKEGTQPRTLQKKILEHLGQEKLPLNSADFAGILLKLERMDAQWTKILELYLSNKGNLNLQAFESVMGNRLFEFENILTYLIWRYYSSANTEEEAGLYGLLALQVCQLLFELGATLFEVYGHFDFEDMVELTRLFSSEIEYSDENPEILLDELYFSLN